MWSNGRVGIALVGFMGAGKTSVATGLAQRLALPLVSADLELTRLSKRESVSAIFDIDGEVAFRELESVVLRAATQLPVKVLDPGGGVVERPENRELLASRWYTVFLSTSFAIVTQRLGDDATRPLWRDRAGARNLFEARQPLYRSVASLTVVTDSLSVDGVVSEIFSALQPREPGFVHGR